MQRKATRRSSIRNTAPPTAVPMRASRDSRPYFCDEVDFEDVVPLLLVDDGEAVTVGVAVVVCVGTENKADVPGGMAGIPEPKSEFDSYMSST